MVEEFFIDEGDNGFDLSLSSQEIVMREALRDGACYWVNVNSIPSKFEGDVSFEARIVGLPMSYNLVSEIPVVIKYREEMSEFYAENFYCVGGSKKQFRGYGESPRDAVSKLFENMVVTRNSLREKGNMIFLCGKYNVRKSSLIDYLDSFFVSKE